VGYALQKGSTYENSTARSILLRSVNVFATKWPQAGIRVAKQFHQPCTVTTPPTSPRSV
jgi:hypothetical protein